ncbi:MAG: hypothetical protein K9J37_10595 [Saprospiraceae bacterium]|nr:hypothetical protein [Saprospiraceae bacterium]MCF8250353.1 hypothetical protein [Saprospiraceae bacterium]MCF8280410.1 hypothetical protein [Bacteroidales bacterium]MCF8312161.1 hypothetical protein [Saprospiraceae bacterium]MCF8441875.1 hypothetical protein [Saprospiraceae bacterium]
MKKEKSQKQILEERFSENRNHFETIMDFISENEYLKTHVQSYFRLDTFYHKTAIGKIRSLYIDAINAAGGNNLGRNGKSCRFFLNEYLNRLPLNAATIDLYQFFHIFSDEVNDFDALFNFLVHDKGLINLGKKKTALFLRNIDWVQEFSSESERLFTNYQIDKLDLRIPVDVVIVTLLNAILKIPSQNYLKPDRDFDLINSFAREILKEKFMQIEDLWFWGFFNLRNNEKVRDIGFNEEKYYASKFIFPNVELEKKLKCFAKLLLKV